VTASEMSVLAHRLESLAGRGRWVSIGSIDSHRSMQLNRCDLDDLRVAAGALREAGRPRGAAFENTERDRLAWRDRAWKAESERDAALAEVERLIADGQQDVPVVDDETREDVLDAVRHAKDTLTEVAVRYPSWGSELRLAGRTLDALAAAYLGRNDK